MSCAPHRTSRKSSPKLLDVGELRELLEARGPVVLAWRQGGIDRTRLRPIERTHGLTDVAPEDHASKITGEVFDGRTALLEIMGYWRPEYLKRKLEKLRRAQRHALIIAVSSNLNVSEDDFKDIPGSVFFFKNKVPPKEVISLLNQGPPPAS